MRPGEASLASNEQLERWRFGCAEKATLGLDAGRRTPKIEDDADLMGKDNSGWRWHGYDFTRFQWHLANIANSSGIFLIWH